MQVARKEAFHDVFFCLALYRSLVVVNFTFKIIYHENLKTTHEIQMNGADASNDDDDDDNDDDGDALSSVHSVYLEIYTRNIHTE